MSGMKDTLGDTPYAYPRSPGHRNQPTSRAAAGKMKSRAATLREKVLCLLAEHPAGLAVHQAAEIANCTVPAIQPRFSELRALGDIKDSGRRHTNKISNTSAAVWVLA